MYSPDMQKVLKTALEDLNTIEAVKSEIAFCISDSLRNHTYGPEYRDGLFQALNILNDHHNKLESSIMQSCGVDTSQTYIKYDEHADAFLMSDGNYYRWIDGQMRRIVW